jgi:NAD(P)-dependent dehydrogenase (short-subunit alcohol dehydrogenase family)
LAGLPHLSPEQDTSRPFFHGLVTGYVLDESARDSVFTRLKEQFDHLDIVFANAGIGERGSIVETSEEVFRLEEFALTW